MKPSFFRLNGRIASWLKKDFLNVNKALPDKQMRDGAGVPVDIVIRVGYQRGAGRADSLNI
jgi:hypothetical protein